MDMKGKFQRNTSLEDSQIKSGKFSADQMMQQDDLENMMNLTFFEQEETGADSADMTDEKMIEANLDLIAAGMKIIQGFNPGELIVGEPGSLDSGVGVPMLSSNARAKRFALYSDLFGQGKIRSRRDKLQAVRDVIKREEDKI
ncbi:hypothetical protein SAMN02910292_02148 [Lachnospiraceae bacterium XBB2008]|nr:hypothetical protein SAMN02910292_02148 [Lachnospiraceae bacterium XBB2008]